MIDPARLAGIGIFARFEADEVATLAGFLEEARFEAGAPLWPPDTLDNPLCFVVEGHVELSRVTEFVERRAVMGIFGPGSLVGEASFFGGDDCYVAAMAVDRLTAGILTRDGLAKLKESSPALHAKLLEVTLMLTSRRMVQAYKRLASIF